MARTETTDYLQSYRFHARIVDGVDFLSSKAMSVGTADGGGKAGFQSITLPDKSFESSEYREGTAKYTKKFPGPSTYSDSSFMRGIVKRESAFYQWGVATEAGGSYRADIVVDHYHREQGSVGAGNEGYITEAPVRQYKFHEAFCIREKMGGDLDATSGEVSIAELDVSMEFYELIINDRSVPIAGDFASGGGG